MRIFQQQIIAAYQSRKNSRESISGDHMHATKLSPCSVLSANYKDWVASERNSFCMQRLVSPEMLLSTASECSLRPESRLAGIVGAPIGFYRVGNLFLDKDEFSLLQWKVED